MGERDAARVDEMAVLDVARRYDAVADILESAVRSHLVQLSFDGAVAGSAHAARGDALRNSTGLIASQLHMWSRASSEIASALRVSSNCYAAVEARGASRLG